MATPILGLDELAAAQAQPEVPINRNSRLLEAVVQISVISKAVSTPPGSPSEGDRYIVGPNATGVWAGRENQLAFYSAGWRFIEPLAGWIAFVQDVAAFYWYSDDEPAGWRVLDTGGGSGGGGGGEMSADEVTYDNVNSGLIADNVQDAIDELADEIADISGSSSGGGAAQLVAIERRILPTGGSTSYVGFGTPPTSGTSSNQQPATTSLLTSKPRNRYQSSGLVNSNAYIVGPTGSAVFRRLTAAPKAWHFEIELLCGLAVARSDQRFFLGIVPGAIDASSDPSSTANIFGIGKDQADTNVQLMHNDGSGSATKTDLGIAFTSLEGKLLRLRIRVEPPGSVVRYQFEVLDDDTKLSGNVSSDLPDADTALRWALHVNTGGTTNTAVNIDLVHVRQLEYLED